ncbi:MoaA/NifB/PqqE/SkfB family radical SAM enzyme [Ruminiclostridium sufflavum DSM 19573]|uniref:MoaA/NifB/PqqE/SkfB family radical SAM enzyme n=1 Tax=Ruminiclostridium sufflavum DSM 19573 TaxID=1121337 RepID=A0A318YAK0_9FIRM|nr:radical SAM protein [Ruminiclostridium sufflavum]PYG89483.1 MoaA/NifB/PqqE/SkfB family radical SAM enzyme [Ruminiclostridium sufflavum DSM 19573]
MSLNWIDFSKKLSENARANGIPLSGAFELTSRCNFKCKMCYVACPARDKRALSRELSAGEWIELGKQARDAGLFNLILTGGEVFVRQDFPEIYEALCNMGLSLTIYSNASLITPEKARWLGKLPPSRLSVTVYGASPETYKRVTGSTDGFKKTMRALEHLKSENISLEIKTTVVEGNFRDYEGIYKIAHTYSDNLGIVNYISPRREGCGSDPTGNRLSPVDIVNYERYISEYGQKMRTVNKKLELKIGQDEMEEQAGLADTEDKAGEGSAFSCQAGKTAFWITWDGRMVPCGLLNEPAAVPLQVGFSNAWQKLREGCTLVPKCKACSKCDVRSECMACPGRLMSETGCFTRPAQYLCEAARYRAELKGQDIQAIARAGYY